mmetsp:Transcript_31789/g.123364  ORF Transcript_31789/g.123364 Transcript_31789/m.123364 type:complete len:119 (+) Transcript_31789:136-492(+)
MYDHKISEYTEKHFDRENISVLNSTFVKEVKQREVVLQKRGSQEKGSLPCGMVVWATGIKPRPFVNSLRKRVGELQSNPRAVVTDTYLRVGPTWFKERRFIFLRAHGEKKLTRMVSLG